jgi:hypothetical protein
MAQWGKNWPRHSGAKHLNLWTEEGLKQLTFGMDMKIFGCRKSTKM